ncbi:HAD superfamily hydrolase (TIGR01509 family) [Janthinobacterium sp. CG_23.3]|uniref:HAD family hydrolase n=1 Tax=unclassified Janthinobacterium TaxID=2610881 RepID=UPI0003499988|nr:MULTISPECIES: HAD family phosphatase [unclassified Janthinobacterium]MEC5161066.1 HAD superfamily hydrolase (TIGR01509 family) [Janthinobacterium sp. CG_S6]
MKKIKGVLWDNDGVLVNTEQLFYETNREVLLEHGIALTRKQFFDWFLCYSYGAWHLLQQKGYSEQRIEALRRERNRRFGEKLAQADNLINSSVDAVLSDLWRRVPMGVVTGSFREHFEQSHRDSRLAGYFDFVVWREMYINEKPEPDSYLMGLERLGLPAHACLAVEDSPRGLRAANAAGLECIVLRTDLTRGHAFDGAFCVVDSMDELRTVLASFVA